MKSKPTRGNGGRKVASAGKEIRPEHSLAQNEVIAALGEAGAEPTCEPLLLLAAVDYANKGRDQRANVFADLIKTGPPLRNAFEERVARILFQKLAPALANLDPKPFLMYAKWIEALREFDRSGKRLPDHYEIFRAANQIESSGLSLKDMTASEFRARLERTIDKRQFRRVKTQAGLQFKPDTGGRPRKPRTIPD